MEVAHEDDGVDKFRQGPGILSSLCQLCDVVPSDLPGSVSQNHVQIVQLPYLGREPRQASVLPVPVARQGGQLVGVLVDKVRAGQPRGGHDGDHVSLRNGDGGRVGM